MHAGPVKRAWNPMLQKRRCCALNPLSSGKSSPPLWLGHDGHRNYVHFNLIALMPFALGVRDCKEACSPVSWLIGR
eukprot:scaffold48021_cov22-Tisochrysis_lutea.AAC.4